MNISLSMQFDVGFQRRNNFMFYNNLMIYNACQQDLNSISCVKRKLSDKYFSNRFDTNLLSDFSTRTKFNYFDLFHLLQHNV